jgi:hypothetical protein
MKIKNLVRIILLVPLSIYLFYCAYHFITHKMSPTYLDCGTIVSKSSDEVAIKHGVTTELYLNIEFKKAGFKSINCEPTTYFKHRIGEHVCFNLLEKQSSLYNINNIIGCGFLIIISIILLVMLIIYLLPDSWAC